MKIKKSLALQASYCRSLLPQPSLSAPLFTKMYFILTTVACLSDELQ